MNALNDIDELHKQDQALQLQQTGVNGCFFIFNPNFRKRTKSNKRMSF